MVTRLVDIANTLGVSTNTVSLALRNSERVRPETRLQIQEVAKRLNYRPNEVAKSLVNRSTRTIGLVLTDINNPLLTQVAKTVENLLSQKGYMTIFAASNNNAIEEEFILESFSARMVDGILIFPTHHQQVEAIAAKHNAQPFLSLALGKGVVDMVGLDEEYGALIATQHLIDLGHKRIAFVDSSSRYGNDSKRNGYQKALKKAGIEFDPNIIFTPERHALRSGYQAAQILLEAHQNLTSIFCANDSLALGVMKYCLDKNISIPDQLSLVGFDDVPYGEFAAIPLTTICSKADEIADQAVDLMMKRLSGDSQSHVEKIKIIPELIVRESSK